MPELRLVANECEQDSIESSVDFTPPDLELIRGDLDLRNLKTLFNTAVHASYLEERNLAQTTLAERLGQWLIVASLGEANATGSRQQARVLAARRFQLAWCMGQITDQFGLLVIRPSDRIKAAGKFKMGLPLDAGDGFLATTAYPVPNGQIHFQGHGRNKPHIAPASFSHFSLQLLQRRPTIPQQAKPKQPSKWKAMLKDSLKSK